MPRIKLSGVITANDLLGGHVVYYTSTQDWSRSIADAAVYPPADSQSALESVQTQVHIVVGPYWAEVELTPDGIPVPVHFRETFRAVGFTPPKSPKPIKESTNVSLQ